MSTWRPHPEYVEPIGELYDAGMPPYKLAKIFDLNVQGVAAYIGIYRRRQRKMAKAKAEKERQQSRIDALKTRRTKDAAKITTTKTMRNNQFFCAMLSLQERGVFSDYPITKDGSLSPMWGWNDPKPDRKRA
jgi:hypothetical protein